MQQMIKAIKRGVLIFLLLLASYYFFFLKPKIELPNRINKAQEILTNHHSTLLQNRLSFVELTKLDPEAGTFNLEKSSLIGTLQETSKEGLKTLENPTKLPEVNKELSERYNKLTSETRELYEKQDRLFEKVFATDSYEAGTELLRSDESIKILTTQTNLILEYKYWLDILSGSVL